jgi:hypothetical protein
LVLPVVYWHYPGIVAAEIIASISLKYVSTQETNVLKNTLYVTMKASLGTLLRRFCGSGSPRPKTYIVDACKAPNTALKHHNDPIQKVVQSNHHIILRRIPKESMDLETTAKASIYIRQNTTCILFHFEPLQFGHSETVSIEMKPW